MTQTITVLPLSAVLAWQSSVVGQCRTDESYRGMTTQGTVALIACMTPDLEAAYLDCMGRQWSETLAEILESEAANDVGVPCEDFTCHGRSHSTAMTAVR